jgi:hypothetical protein
MKTTIALFYCALLWLQLITCSPAFGQTKKEHAGLFPIRENGKYGYINAFGKVVIKPRFQFVDISFNEGLARISNSGKVGFIDKTGKIVITPKFDYAGIFSEGFALVIVGEKVGVIDKTGKMVVPPKFDKFITNNDFFVDGLAPVRVGNKVGYIDSTGEFVIAPQFDGGSGFSEGLAVVGVGDIDNREIRKCGYIDKTGKFIVRPVLVQCTDFQGGFAVVGAGTYNSWRTLVINKTGGPIIDSRTFYPKGYFSEGLAVACKRNLGSDADCGYIDKSGNWVIQPIFDQAYPFSEGLAAVEIADASGRVGMGFINKTGKLVINSQFWEREDRFVSGVFGNREFSGGLARVRTLDEGKMVYINKTGKIVWQEKP